MDWIKGVFSSIGKLFAGPIPKVVLTVLGALMGGTGLTIWINSNNRTSTVYNGLPNDFRLPEGVQASPFRPVNVQGGTGEFRLVAMTDGNRWKFASRGQVVSPENKLVRTNDVVEPLVRDLAAEAQAIVVVGLASSEGSDISEKGRGADRADTVVGIVRPIARQKNVELYSVNLGRYIGKTSDEGTQRQRRLVLLEARNAPNRELLPALTKEFLKSATKEDKLVLNPADYKEAENDCRGLQVVTR